MKKIRAVIFDCDGVMFDTREVNRIYYNRILKHFGIPDMTEEQLEKAHMDTAKNAIKDLLNGQHDLEEVYKYAATLSYNDLVPHMIMEPDLKDLLKGLKKSGFITAIATNRTSTMPLVISHHGLEGLFDLVVTTKDVENPKPAPDQLFKILEHFNLGSDEAIYIGDSKFDQLASDSAGVIFFSFRNSGLKSVKNLRSLSEIPEIVGLN
ncbi:HAD family hydrolase [Desulforegula conservatrix]|uniref:HAD family hydrolase n=1 Tax=Desulforegula conservatrix TaxID=153026 RepID=UPI00042017BC|nr:HAD family hydrolase [Desulforegula conservatrix]